MRLLLATLLLATSSYPGELLFVGEGYQSRIYIDPTTIKKDGDKRLVVTYTNYVKRDENGMMSTVSLSEYDCNTKLRRIVEVSGYSLSTGYGKRIATETSTPWVTTPKGSPADSVSAIVCAK